MKFKVLALMAIAGLFTASLAFAAPAPTADDMPGMNSNTMADGSAVPPQDNIGNSAGPTGVDMGPLASNDTMNSGMNNGMSNMSNTDNSSSTPGNTPSSSSSDSSNSNDDMSADTATGDDDY
jgi:hypothetical protein